jgi:cysteinyl-tRNA synthetase
LAYLDQVFGLELSQRTDISDNLKQLIKDRDAAREAKDWQASDHLRDKLKEQGLGIRDTQFGTYWNRLND